ncbi:hypothetical protein AB674_15640 [Flavobacterium sp. ABG]|nr:hypothetical protein AB674_15640 [Flavobacterium sp. ABG]
MSERIQKNNVGNLNAINTNNKPLNFIRRLLLVVLFISKIAQDNTIALSKICDNFMQQILNNETIIFKIL